MKLLVNLSVCLLSSQLLACDQGTLSADSNPLLVNSKTKNRISDYQQARHIFWAKLYPKSGRTLYCDQAFESQHRQGINIEHVFPMSWVTNALECGKRNQCRHKSKTFNLIEADLHNLFPSRTDVNYARSSYRFGIIPGEQRPFGAACDFEFDERQRQVEPAPQVRGDIARAMFYMAYKYQPQGLVIFSKQQQLLFQWHLADPPSNQEHERNAHIEKIQGNLNPFIQQPDLLVDLIKQGAFPTKR